MPAPSLAELPDVFRHDRTTGTTIRVSVASGGAQADAASAAPRISGDGRYVVFESVATTLVAGDTNQRRDVFLRDVQTSTTTRISVATSGAQSDRDASAPSISDDGARVAFLSDATTLDAAADPLACNAAVLALHARVRPGGARPRRRRALGAGGLAHGVSGVDVGRPSSVNGGIVIACDGLTVAVLVYGLVDIGSAAVQRRGLRHLLVRAGSARPSPTCRRCRSSRPGAAPGRPRRRCDRPLPGLLQRGPVDLLGLGLFDRQTWIAGRQHRARPAGLRGVSLSADGLTVFFASSGSTVVAGDTNGAADVFAFDLDGDNDGMSVGVGRLSSASRRQRRRMRRSIRMATA